MTTAKITPQSNRAISKLIPNIIKDISIALPKPSRSRSSNINAWEKGNITIVAKIEMSTVINPMIPVTSPATLLLKKIVSRAALDSISRPQTQAAPLRKKWPSMNTINAEKKICINKKGKPQELKLDRREGIQNTTDNPNITLVDKKSCKSLSLFIIWTLVAFALLFWDSGVLAELLTDGVIDIWGVLAVSNAATGTLIIVLQGGHSISCPQSYLG